MKPMYHKTDAGYEGLGVDVLEQIRIQAKRRKVDHRVAKSVNDGISANNDPAATGFSYRISVQGCH
jgi:polar amino acid transport system substrate-binding protein